MLSDLANRLKIKYIMFKCVLRKFAEVQVKDVNMTLICSFRYSIYTHRFIFHTKLG